MSDLGIKQVAVAGAGTMGRGIAQATVLAGYKVRLYDVAADVLDDALQQIGASVAKGVSLGKVSEEQAGQVEKALTTTTELAALAEADLIIEAAPEAIEIKRELFEKLDGLAGEEAIFASNTSSLSINVLADATQRDDRFLGLHFFNPAHIMKLVEVIAADRTSAKVLDSAMAFVRSLGKEPVRCKDTPAFIVNRVARPFYGEAFRLLGEDAAGVETIDELMRSVGFRMGPFELVDLIGCDVNYAVTQSVYEAYFQDEKYRPHPIQRRMVESGRLGRKRGRGFYDYDG
ncbi:MAG: 3-hydroxyacyl-CoA dehydrogenase family protein [Chloroflexota bacterium]